MSKNENATKKDEIKQETIKTTDKTVVKRENVVDNFLANKLKILNNMPDGASKKRIAERLFMNKRGF